MDTDYEDLYRWVEEHNLSRPKRNINRDFSDAIPLVEILKVYWPRLVEEHNYSPKNSISCKKTNWQLLNKKVLSKIKIRLSDETIDNLAKSIPGEIEKLLSDVKEKVEALQSANSEESVSQILCLEKGDHAAAILPIKVKQGERVTMRKLITEEAYTEMENALREKEEANLILQNKVEHLENLLKIKEEMVKDLNQQLVRLMNDSTNPLEKKDRFFKLF